MASSVTDKVFEKKNTRIKAFVKYTICQDGRQQRHREGSDGRTGIGGDESTAMRSTEWQVLEG